MFDEHIRNLEQTIRNYQASIEDEGLEPRVDVGINVGINEQKVLELLRKNNQITAKEIAGLLGISLRHSERLITSLKQKGMIQRVGSNKNGYWEIIVK